MTSQSKTMFTSLSVDQNSATPYTDATKWRRPDKPRVKRPLNPFMVWSQIERHKIIENSPDVHHAEVSKLLGKRWKALSATQKAPYIKEAERLRKLHRAEFPDYKYKPRRRKKVKAVPCNEIEDKEEDNPAETCIDDENLVDLTDEYQSQYCEPASLAQGGSNSQILSNYNLCHQQQPPVTQESFYCPPNGNSKAQPTPGELPMSSCSQTTDLVYLEEFLPPFEHSMNHRTIEQYTPHSMRDLQPTMDHHQGNLGDNRDLHLTALNRQYYESQDYNHQNRQHFYQ